MKPGACSGPESSALRAAFPSLSRPEIATFRQGWEPAALGRDETLDLHGGSGKRVVVCVTGYVCAHRFPFGRGRPRCLQVLSHGDVAGLALLAGRIDLGRPEVILALTAASLLVTSPDAIVAFLRSHPYAFRDITEMLAREVAIQQLRLERQSSESIVSNLALLLLMLSVRFGESRHPDAIPKPLTARRWLATFLGVSPESVQRALRALRAEGLVSTADAEVRILDRRRLRERANIDDSVLALFAQR